MSLAERLKEIMKSKCYTQTALAKLTGIRQTDISSIITGRIKKRSIHIPTIAHALGVDLEWLYHGTVNTVLSNPQNLREHEAPTNYVPILSFDVVYKLDTLTAMDLIMENTDFHPIIGKGSLKSFALRIRDDAMVSSTPGKNTFIENGVIIVDPEITPESGDYVVAAFKNSTTALFRQYVVDGKDTYLRPLNHDYNKIQMDETIKIYGVVIGHTNWFRGNLSKNP